MDLFSIVIGSQMPADEIRNLRYCYEVLRRRALEAGDQQVYWQMKLRVALYFLQRYDAGFSPENWHYVKELSEEEESGLLHSHPLLQAAKVFGGFSCGHMSDFELELKDKIERFLTDRIRQDSVEDS